MDLANEKKISVVGNSGAGKSTFSKKLGKRLGIEVYSIDKIFWLPGWELRNQREYNEIHNNWLRKESWIIDGVGYWEELETRLTVSDLVIFLDVPPFICEKRVQNRIESEKYSPNPDITEGCLYGDVKERQLEVIQYFDDTLRPRLIKLFSMLGKEQVKVIRSYSEL